MWKRVVCAVLMVAACGDGDHPETSTAPTVVRIDSIAPGTECANGGVAVVWGADDDGDGVLDDSEIDERDVRCSAGAKLLTRREELDPGAQCQYGGEVVHTGVDKNQNMFLDDDEIQSSTVICAAAPSKALVRVESVAPGMQCPDGGTRIVSGTDLDNDGILDNNEITNESVTCGDPAAVPEVEVGAGYGFSCARKASGTVWCWGDNSFGKRALPEHTNWIDPTPVPSILGATDLSVGEYHACAVDGEGRVQCWGWNQFDALGDAGANGGPRVVPLAAKATKVAAGNANTCAILTNGELWCWGYNESGAVTGVPSTGGVLPTRVTGLPPIVDVAVGGQTPCAVTNTGDVWCWGANSFGQAGAAIAETVTPAAVAGVANAVAISVGGSTACARLADGGLRCWGSNYGGQLADNGPDRPTPTAIALPLPAIDVAVGGSSTCAILGDGSTRCWGNNAFGKLGRGTFRGFFPEPVAIEGFYGAATLSAGIYHTCAIRGGEPWCWGNNDEGESGTMLQGRPVQVLTDVDDVEAGFYGTCAHRTDDTAWCWGSFGYGDQEGMWQRTPAPVAAWTDVVDIAAGSEHACIVRSNGSLWCWGANGHGELGDGTKTTRNYLAQSSVTNVVSVEAGGTQTCAIRTGGELQCWGYDGNDFGGGTQPHVMLSNVVEVRLSWHNGCAIDTTHRLWCWGENDEREVPGGFSKWVATPVQVLTDVAAVIPKSDEICAIKLDGNELCWGAYYSGGPQIVRNVGVGAFGAGGLGHECVVLDGGAVWCSGTNLWAQIGDGTLTYRNEPFDTGLRGVVDIASEWIHTCAATASGAVWCWGSNEGGQIGAGGQAGMVGRPAPVAL